MTAPVERVCLTHLQIPLKEPFRISGTEVGLKDAILLVVETRDAIGLGECSPGPASGCESLDGCWIELTERIAPSLLGRTFNSVDDIATLAATWSGGRCARAGAETACWDLLGQARHATIAELLGASSEQLERSIESGLSLGLYPTVVELLKTIETHLAEGYRRVKIEIEPGRDVELVRAVRQHFGDIPLMVEASGAYTNRDLDIFRELDDLDLLMFEQPMAADDIDGLVQLQRAVATPVCLDETANSVERATEAIGRGACKVVSLKLQYLGGFGPAVALHDHCYKHGVSCWVGTIPELGVGRAQGLHLATLGNCRYPTDIEPSPRWFVDDYVVPLIEHSAPGMLSVPTRPGLGFQVDRTKVRRYQVRYQEVGTGS
ncbi:o-succinylbenzoate synthase [Singulisphaera sp. PoT]|uniref:o-succinylbenzoate synthase n=1 Tax=Singulisphaera sp. PoT TaxID=3411797 RepID=UPI003BF5B12B